MKYKVTNNLDKFDFKDFDLNEIALEKDSLRIEMAGGIARYNNPCNEKYVDCYIAETELRFLNPSIDRFFLEGSKYYNANDVLIEEIPDKELSELEYQSKLKSFNNSRLFYIEGVEKEENKYKCQISIDTESEETYWIVVSCEKVVIGWDRFMNRVAQ